MAPSFDCMISLFCAEEASGDDWEDEAVSYCDRDNAEADLVVQRMPELPVEDDEMIDLLLEQEVSLMPQNDYVQKFESKILDLGSREQAVNWMLNVQACYHFNRLTAFLSANYLDRFLSSHQIPRGKPWMLQLLAVGCVSLAAKMEETEVPLLLDLQVGEVQHLFEARTIQRMELLIMSTLKWRMRSVTPFSYLNYLLHKIGICRRSSIAFISRVEELILNSCRVIRSVVYRPSVVAVASVICACEELLPMQAPAYKKVLLAIWPVREASTLDCAHFMQEILVDPFWTSNKTISRNSSAPQSPIGVLDAACFSCDSDTTISTMRSVNGLSSGNMQLQTPNANALATAPPTPHDVSRKRTFRELYNVSTASVDGATEAD